MREFWSEHKKLSLSFSHRIASHHPLMCLTLVFSSFRKHKHQKHMWWYNFRSRQDNIRGERWFIFYPLESGNTPFFLLLVVKNFSRFDAWNDDHSLRYEQTIISCVTLNKTERRIVSSEDHIWCEWMAGPVSRRMKMTTMIHRWMMTMIRMGMQFRKRQSQEIKRLREGTFFWGTTPFQMLKSASQESTGSLPLFLLVINYFSGNTCCISTVSKESLVTFITMMMKMMMTVQCLRWWWWRERERDFEKEKEDWNQITSCTVIQHEVLFLFFFSHSIILFRNIRYENTTCTLVVLYVWIDADDDMSECVLPSLTWENGEKEKMRTEKKMMIKKLEAVGARDKRMTGMKRKERRSIHPQVWKEVPHLHPHHL